MSFWNPKNSQYLYFHVVFKDDDFYIKVDTVNQRVFKCCYKPMRIQGKYFKLGVYELKYVTFTGNYAFKLKYGHLRDIKGYEARDGHFRGRVIYTSRRQWTKAISTVLKEIV